MNTTAAPVHVIVFRHTPTQMFSFPYPNKPLHKPSCCYGEQLVFCYPGVYVWKTHVQLIKVMRNLTGQSALRRRL